jgi:hypothetical protein
VKPIIQGIEMSKKPIIMRILEVEICEYMSIEKTAFEDHLEKKYGIV